MKMEFWLWVLIRFRRHIVEEWKKKCIWFSVWVYKFHGLLCVVSVMFTCIFLQNPEDFKLFSWFFFTYWSEAVNICFWCNFLVMTIHISFQFFLSFIWLSALNEIVWTWCIIIILGYLIQWPFCYEFFMFSPFLLLTTFGSRVFWFIWHNTMWNASVKRWMVVLCTGGLGDLEFSF